jgi:hypothetical protein
MSRTIPAKTYVQAIERLRSRYSQARDQLTQLSAQNSQQLQELAERTEVALTELAAAILPELSPAALARAVQLCGYAPLVHSDPLTAMENTRQTLTRRVLELEADRSYRDRLLLRAPRIGLLTREVAELEEFRAPLQDIVSKCQHVRLHRLLQVGYDTPAYDVPFWRMSYYADWRAADQICERFTPKRTFGELRKDLLAAEEAVAVYDRKLEKLRAAVRQGEALEYEHDDLTRQLAELPQSFLKRLREQLASYLRDMDLVAIGDRLASEPQVDGLAKRYLGLRKQTEYLRESGKHLLQNTAAPVNQTLWSLDRELRKYQKPKAANAAVAIDRMSRLQQLEQRYAKCQQQAVRYQQTSRAVYMFEDYVFGRLDDDFLWWDLIAYAFTQRTATPEKVYGYFIPEVAEFHQNHPDHHYRGPERDEGLADMEAQAAAASVGLGRAEEHEGDIS